MNCFSLGCLVMASGQSKRFGSNKLLAPFGDVCLLEYTLSHIPIHLFQKCVVVTRSKICCSIAENCGFDAIFHSLPYRSDTLRLGIEQMQGLDGCLVVQADQPLCSQQSYIALIHAFQNNPTNFFRLGWQNISASPVLFPALSFDALCSLPQKSGGAAALPKDPSKITVVSALSPWELQDVDTLDDLQKLLQIAKEQF